MLPPNRQRVFELTLCTVGLVLAAILFWTKIANDKRVILLRPENGAEWIRLDRPFDLTAWGYKGRVTEYRIAFELKTAPAEAVLSYYCLGASAVYLDDSALVYADPSLRVGEWDWRERHELSLNPRLLTPGRHELRFHVVRHNGPAALLAYCEPLGLATGTDWQARPSASREPADRSNRNAAVANDSPSSVGVWKPVVSVDTLRRSKLSQEFPSTFETLRSGWWIVVLLFGVVFAGGLAKQRSESAARILRPLVPTASGVRWIVLGGWIVLAINNLWKVPLDVGFDVTMHLEYVRFIVERRSLPLASDGWQMFQSPLYYMISAGLYQALQFLGDEQAISRSLRVVPLLCGIAQVELTYRILRCNFPNRDDLQALGTVLGGLLPMNLYMSQYVGNEPLCAALTAVAVLMVIRVLHQPSLAHSWRWQCKLGLVLGLAILTKVTAVLLLPPVLVAVAYALYSRGGRVRVVLAGGVRILAAAGLVAGWYYLRNWYYFDKPFVGGWDPIRGFAWWQDPGYRTMGQITDFGEVLVHPIHSGFAGFWDSLYSTCWLDGNLSGMGSIEDRPPWNFSLLLVMPWLSLLPVMATGVGVLAAFGHRDGNTRHALQFAIATIGLYLAAILYLFLQLPVASTAKATYMLGLIGCYALLAAAGCEFFMRNAALRAVVVAGVVCWGVISYAGYFVR